MKRLSHSVCLVALISSWSVAQGLNWSTRSNHAAMHAKDSFVLVFGKDSIQRGPVYSMRATALDYQKTRHVRNLVWFSTGDGCFVSTDPKVVASKEGRLTTIRGNCSSR
jgi:hypothetical protein